MNETNTIRWNVLNHIKGLGDSIVNCHLEPENTTLYQTTIMRLNEYFGTSETQSWIMCFGIYQHFNDNYNDKIPLSDFANFLDVNVLKVAAMHSEFLELESRNLIEYSHSSSTFKVTSEVISHVLLNEPIPYCIAVEKSYFDFLAKMANTYENRKYTEDSCDELVDQLLTIEERNDSLPLVIRCKEKFADDKTRFMFYDLCNDSLSGMPSYLLSTIEDIYEGNERFRIARQFLDEKHCFMQHKFVEFNQKGNMLEAKIQLTEEGKNSFLMKTTNCMPAELTTVTSKSRRTSGQKNCSTVHRTRSRWTSSQSLSHKAATTASRKASKQKVFHAELQLCFTESLAAVKQSRCTSLQKRQVVQLCMWTFRRQKAAGLAKAKNW